MPSRKRKKSATVPYVPTEEPLRCYLVQRGMLRPATDARKGEGFDGSFMLDYMGAAEYEFGSVPQSLNRILADLDTYVWVEVPQLKSAFGKGTLRVYGPKAQIDAIVATVLQLAKGKIRTKEGSYLKENIVEDQTFGDSKWYYRDLWWNLDYDWFVVFGDETRRVLTSALTAVRAKRAAKAAAQMTEGATK